MDLVNSPQVHSKKLNSLELFLIQLIENRYPFFHWACLENLIIH